MIAPVCPPPLPVTVQPVAAAPSPALSAPSLAPEPAPAIPVLPPLAESATPFYRGYDLHAYTVYLQQQLPRYLDDLKMHFPDTVPPELWHTLLQSIRSKLGDSVAPALQNMNGVYAAGAIRNPELPGMNFAVVLLVLWDAISKLDDPSMWAHFRQTLEDVGTTCLAGITDRLFADWIALHPL